MAGAPTPRPRLSGLDLARGLALIGMVLVNFEIVMAMPAEGDPSVGAWLQGRAAALFVVLAGIGFTLGGRSKDYRGKTGTTLRRSAVLLTIGLLNMLIFPADIIHYYAIYFLVGLAFLRASDRVLLAGCAALIIVSLILLLGLDFDRGWDWDSYDYLDFWTVDGFVRNLFYNGWHPVFPWAAFLLYGMWLGRRALADRTFQTRCMIGGTAVYLLTELTSAILIGLSESSPDLALLVDTAPVPAVPLYMIAGAAAATAVTGLCLRMAPPLSDLWIVRALGALGRQSLTLYIAHIVIGMGVIEALGGLETQSVGMALAASALFCAAALIYASLWSRYFKSGPLEYILRRV